MAILVTRALRLKRLYRASPVWLQHLETTGYGWLWKHHRYGGRFSEFVHEYAARERYREDEWQAYQTAALRRLLDHACRHVPYYRESFARARVTMPDSQSIGLDDLGHLPMVTKQDLRRRPSELLADTVHRGSLYGMQTSGTTGTPVTVHVDRDAFRSWHAAHESRWRAWAGVNRRNSRAMIGGRRVVPQPAASAPFWRYNWAERQIYLSAYHISPDNTPHYVRAVNRFEPDYLVGYASSLFLLARLIREAGLVVFSPRAVLTTSETLRPEMRETIESVYQCPAFDAYGSVELCCLATECERHRLHVSPDVGILELLDETGRPVGPGEAGEIVATGLLNHAQPLIRYRTGDWAVRSEEACPCGRAMPVIREIVGRIEDLVIAPDGREVVRLHGAFEAVPSIREGQIVQEDYAVYRVRLVMDRALRDEDHRVLQQRFEELVGPVTLTCEVVDHIERSANGKFQVVISKVRRAPTS
jgi:phenylacetate-CoA ligase